MPSDREALRLADIVEQIDLVTQFVGEMDYEAYLGDPLRIAAVERCLQRITEACIKIGPARMAVIAPDQPFAAIRSVGNILRHDYDIVMQSHVWRTVREDLPNLRNACARALAAAEDD